MKTVRLRVRQSAEELEAMCQEYAECHYDNSCPIGDLECPFTHSDGWLRHCERVTREDWERVLEDEPQGADVMDRCPV